MRNHAFRVVRACPGGVSDPGNEESKGQLGIRACPRSPAKRGIDRGNEGKAIGGGVKACPRKL